jgi:class 3 adenylate cyclase
MSTTDADRNEATRRGRTLLEVGNFVAALDIARQALEQWPDDAALLHTAILAMASCGSTTTALSMFHASALAHSDDEDHAALEARLLKDLAWHSPAKERNDRLLTAAARYHEIHLRSRGTYSAVNAASLFAIAAEEEHALSVAREILPVLSDASPQGMTELQQYFHWATLAETAAVLDDAGLFARASAAADRLERNNLWARARTYMQLTRLGDVRPALQAAIEQWHRPQVAFLAVDEPPYWICKRELGTVPVDAALVFCARSQRISPAAIERFLAQGTSVHLFVERIADSPNVLLPLTGSPGRKAALDVSELHLDTSLGTESERYATCVQAALGMSINRALDAGVPWSCLCISEEEVRPVCVLDRPELEAVLAAGECAPAEDALGRGSSGSTRPVAVLFADVVGYSGFSAAQVQKYWSWLMPKVGEVLKGHASHILLKKTWGDALHAIVRDATTAAHIALRLRHLAEQAWSAQERDSVPTFRISLHFGLVDEGIDPVEDSRNFFGPQLSLAARVEVVAPPGGIYVTEAFAARLTLEGSTAFNCSYVGSVKLPKGYGEFRLLALQPRGW